ncbi:unnamed protein product [Timema podura]|uniref:Uncharacterized protein n=1 Tax=Timema podura TaxID=61482 RepID=A0ABN7NLP4_TIMPD|nr:unnamed protein product [Timema podura]
MGYERDSETRKCGYETASKRGGALSNEALRRVEEVQNDRVMKELVKEGFGNQIILCRDRGLNPGPSEQKSDT